MIRGVVSLVLGLASGAVLAAEEATRSAPPRLTDGLGNTAIALIAVLGLIAALAWAMRRFGRVPMGGRGVVQVLGGVSLGNRERAVLLSVDGQRLLVGVAPGQVRTLHVLDASGGDDGFARQLDAASRDEGGAA